MFNRRYFGIHLLFLFLSVFGFAVPHHSLGKITFELTYMLRYICYRNEGLLKCTLLIFSNDAHGCRVFPSPWYFSLALVFLMCISLMLVFFIFTLPSRLQDYDVSIPRCCTKIIPKAGYHTVFKLLKTRFIDHLFSFHLDVSSDKRAKFASVCVNIHFDKRIGFFPGCDL